jgi:hypothetical protein
LRALSALIVASTAEGSACGAWRMQTLCFVTARALVTARELMTARELTTE